MLEIVTSSSRKLRTQYCGVVQSEDCLENTKSDDPALNWISNQLAKYKHTVDVTVDVIRSYIILFEYLLLKHVT